MNRTLMDKVRCMLVQSKLLKALWVEILLTTCYLVNLSHSTAIDYKTTFEIQSGKLVDYGILRAFGCLAYVHISQGKLAPKALRGVFIKYLEDVKEYKIQCTDLNPPKCIISRDVVFNEGVLVKDSQAFVETNENSKSTDKLEFKVEPSE